MDSRKVIRDVLGDYDDVMSAISEIQPAESVEIRATRWSWVTRTSTGTSQSQRRASSSQRYGSSL